MGRKILHVITVYAYKNCNTCREALKWLDQKGIAHEIKAIRDRPPALSELKLALDAAAGDLRKLFNISGTDYRQLGMKDKLAGMGESEALELLSRNGNLVKRPLLIDGDKVLVGFKKPEWSAAFGA